MAAFLRNHNPNLYYHNETCIPPSSERHKAQNGTLMFVKASLLCGNDFVLEDNAARCGGSKQKVQLYKSGPVFL